MSERVCLVHYHEIGLKGKNRSLFENQLVRNIQHALRNLPVREVRRIAGHLLVRLHDEESASSVAQALLQVPGVARVSLAWRCSLDEDEFCEAAVRALREAEQTGFMTFKVHAHRSATSYPRHSIDINRMVGSILCERFPDKKVQMHHPDVTVTVLVNQAKVFVYATSMRGVGGLPVGSAGKVVTLLSSGFDSPVATWSVGRRGAICIPVHFSGRPMTADTSEWLTADIVRALAPAGIIGRLYVVPFGEQQREISLAVPQKLRIIMYRRVMFAVAERIARLEGAKALVTGESLGQVASQTLENIAAVNEMVSIPVLRPLIGSDKQEIIECARRIGTYDISCETAPDCCTLFMPRRPETHARLDEVHAAWDLFDHDALIDTLVSQIEYLDFDQCPSYRAPRCLRHRHEDLAPAWSDQDTNMLAASVR
jgi:thiamine biosynthesis protein ThiI